MCSSDLLDHGGLELDADGALELLLEPDGAAPLVVGAGGVIDVELAIDDFGGAAGGLFDHPPGKVLSEVVLEQNLVGLAGRKPERTQRQTQETQRFQKRKNKGEIHASQGRLPGIQTGGW